MAERFSGDLKINVEYDDRGFYRTAVSREGRVLWRGRVRPPAAGFGRGDDRSGVEDPTRPTVLAAVPGRFVPTASVLASRSATRPERVRYAGGGGDDFNLRDTITVRRGR